MSHFSDLGFAFARPEDLPPFMEEILPQGEALPTPNGFYIFWSPGEGIELWIRADSQKNLIGCSPHYTGTGQMRIAITQTFRSQERPLDGSCYAWANPQDDNPYSGLYPFAADMPDFDLIEERVLLVPLITVQIAAFAEEIRCFSSEGEFLTAQPEGPHPAAESFTPTWQHGDEPVPNAHVTGRILEGELRTNPATGQTFHVLSVRTLGGTIDVVADPELTRGRPIVNGIIQGTFWLSARVISDLPLPKEPRYAYRRRR